MTEQLERLTAEVRNLTPAELNELRLWLEDYQPERPAPTETERRAHWAKHFEELERFWGDRSPLKENPVLVMREEERY